MERLGHADRASLERPERRKGFSTAGVFFFNEPFLAAEHGGWGRLTTLKNGRQRMTGRGAARGHRHARQLECNRRRRHLQKAGAVLAGLSAAFAAW